MPNQLSSVTPPATSLLRGSDALLCYHGLPEDEKLILRLRALTLVPVHRSVFRAIVVHAARRVLGSGYRITHARIDGLHRALRERRLLDSNNTCPTDTALAVALDTLEDPCAPRLLEACGERADSHLTTRGIPYWEREPARLADSLRHVRIAVFANQSESLERALKEARPLEEHLAESYFQRMASPSLRQALRGLEEVSDWLLQRSPRVLDILLGVKLEAVLNESRCTLAMKHLLEEASRRPSKSFSAETFRKLGQWKLLAGDWKWFARRSRSFDTQDPQANWLLASAALLQGQSQEALARFEEGRNVLRKLSRKRSAVPGSNEGLMYCLALLAQNDEKLLGATRTVIRSGLSGDPAFALGYRALDAATCLLQGREQDAQDAILEATKLVKKPSSPWSLACFALATHLASGEHLGKLNKKLLVGAVKKLRTTYPVPAQIVADVLIARGLGHLVQSASIRDRSRPTGLREFADLIHAKPAWERRLDTVFAELEILQATAGERDSRFGQKRLAFLVNVETNEVEAVEQIWRKQGGWSAGRSISLRRLQQPDDRLRYLTDLDRKALYIREESTGYYAHEVRYVFEEDRALPGLVGHPAVFDARNRKRQLELVAGEPELAVSKTPAGGYCLQLSHQSETPRIFLDQETENRYRVVPFTEIAVRLAKIIGKPGLKVPGESEKRVLDISRMALEGITVRADLDDTEAEGEPGDSRPVVRMMPLDEGLKVSLHVRPFGEIGPYFSAGSGPRAVVANIEGSHRRVLRDMDTERMRAAALVDACPSLNETNTGTDEWVFDDLESSLQAMLELQNLPDSAHIEWPENASHPIPGMLGARNLRLKVQQERDWFAISAEVPVDEELVIDMGELLDSLEQATGRFIPLDDGRFLALTNKLRQQLDRLKSLSSGRGSKGEHFTPLGTLALRDFLDEVTSLESDTAWRSFRERVAKAEKHQPKIPGILKASLRNYQRDGFEWSSRLAALGAGACLADDMGLGKTVQTLALLLERREGGPALVIAPTSVCPNWEAEARRFAPTLECIRFAELAERKGTIDRMDAGAVLVASYGMVSRNVETLRRIRWHTLVIDEAQAVKNPDARRTQAVGSLPAEFRIALTGTPIENNLEELWSLFRILNPGLLGSRANFRKRYLGTNPDRTSAARNDLRTLIRPFILRRTKSMVLSELPPRTEQVIRIEPDDEEQAFHEALRRQAVRRLEDLAEANPGKRRIRILAEITRLRQACCHPRLIDNDSDVPSAKLKTLMDLVGTIIAGRHKALVFSQFVSHLALVRPQLEQANIPYQYLDGSTSPRQREARIRAFQAGEGDLFLISLRAGGTGLNLTAADYVLHLDPWWNPAVEDQASDRAHRIGQDRPVTIYRLVVRDSIEEKILELHRDKRELADELLAGTETVPQLREEDLLKLIADP